jgi:hypothetical protein
MTMVSVLIRELFGRALDYAVAQCRGEAYPVDARRESGVVRGPCRDYSVDWSVAGPIIEQESITLIRCDDEYVLDSEGRITRQRTAVWAAVLGEQHSLEDIRDDYGEPYVGGYVVYENETSTGLTPLVAAMRCYVASKTKGDSVMIPEMLL